MSMGGCGCGGSTLGGSSCDVIAVPSANKTDKINPMSCLHEQGVAV